MTKASFVNRDFLAINYDLWFWQLFSWKHRKTILCVWGRVTYARETLFDLIALCVICYGKPRIDSTDGAKCTLKYRILHLYIPNCDLLYVSRINKVTGVLSFAWYIVVWWGFEVVNSSHLAYSRSQFGIKRWKIRYFKEHLAWSVKSIRGRP